MRGRNDPTKNEVFNLLFISIGESPPFNGIVITHELFHYQVPFAIVLPFSQVIVSVSQNEEIYIEMIIK